MIECKICGEKCHSIQAHLNKSHGLGSAKPATLEGYTKQYPGAPLLSPQAQEALARRQQQQVEAIVAPVPSAAPAPGSKMAFDKLFDLVGQPGSKSPRGEDIMISIMEQSGYEELIPPPEEYFPNVENLKNIVMGLQLNIPTYVWGPSGVGKTAGFRHVCNKTHRRLLRVQHDASVEASHILGERTVKKTVDADGKVHTFIEFEMGSLPLAMINGWVYLADEIDRALPEVLSVYQAVLEGQPLYLKEAPEGQRLIQPHPEFRFVATGNTNGTGDETGLYRATQRQDAATFERFGIVIEATYPEPDVEQRMLVERVKCTEDHAKKFLAFARKVRAMYPNELSLTIGPRVLLNMARLGMARLDPVKGVELAYANRLPSAEKIAALENARRILA